MVVAQKAGGGEEKGLQSKLKAHPHKLAVLSLFLANYLSLNNKMNELRLRITPHSLNHCALIIMETWLDQNSPDAAIELAAALSSEWTGPFIPVRAEEEDFVFT